MKNALIKAMEGGYEYKGFDHDGSIRPTANPELCLLDKDFWVCLGKSLGWSEYNAVHCDSCIEDKNSGYGDDIEHCCCRFPDCQWSGWRHKWFLFIDHLAEGKDPEEFFNQLKSK